jgi:hypothetical protein
VNYDDVVSNSPDFDRAYGTKTYYEAFVIYIVDVTVEAKSNLCNGKSEPGAIKTELLMRARHTQIQI